MDEKPRTCCGAFYIRMADCTAPGVAARTLLTGLLGEHGMKQQCTLAFLALTTAMCWGALPIAMKQSAGGDGAF